MAGKSSTAVASSSLMPTSQPPKSNGANEDTAQNSPFSKVTSSGKIVCIICPGVTIKSWKIHQLSAEHKRNIKAHHRTSQATSVALSGKQPEQSKAPRVEKEPPAVALPKEPPRSILKNPLAKTAQPDIKKLEQARHQDAKEVDVKSIESSGQSVANGNASASSVNTGLVSPSLKRRAPTGSDIDAPEAKQEKLEASSQDQTGAGAGAASALPEGFFDDPRLDAKARNLEYRDPQDIEWDRYQKALREEETKSEQVRTAGLTGT